VCVLYILHSISVFPASSNFRGFVICLKHAIGFMYMNFVDGILPWFFYVFLEYLVITLKRLN
jgi:hypothetical protein